MIFMKREFFERDGKRVAKELLGKILTKDGMRGLIVETEAYYGEDDPASHASKGPTERNKIMYGQPGRAYVYLCYGNHWLLNVVTEKEGVPGAVLIRAIEPVKGLRKMRGKRDADYYNLTNGPGKLTQALGIDKEYNGKDLTKGSIEDGKRVGSIVSGPRVGVNDRESDLRFLIKGNKFVSKKYK